MDTDSGYIFDADNQMVAEVRAWGYLQYFEDAEKLQDTLGQMLAKAFNEYAEKILNERNSVDEGETLCEIGGHTWFQPNGSMFKKCLDCGIEKPA